MKKLILSLIVIFVAYSGFSYTWENYGPESIKANKLCLFVCEYAEGIICLDTGMYVVNEFFGNDWEYYSNFNMPVIDAVQCNYNVDSILVVMGNGSYSDGIYSFNLITGQFQVLFYCINPNFICKYYSDGMYYVGYENGMLISDDGFTWNEISFFSGKNCEDIQIYNDNIAVAIDQPNDNVYWSEDSGENWETIDGEFKISKLLLHYWGYLSGICTESSSNCGYYKLSDYSMVWENEFFSEDLNTLGFDNDSRSFLGWHGSNVAHKGIARYTNYLSFFNQGLPNLNINDITSNDEFVGGSIVFCCTDEGIYYCVDYVGIDPLKEEDVQVLICPNPVKDKMQIKIKSDKVINEISSIEIYSNQGNKVDEINFESISSNECVIIWNKGNLPAGIFYLVLKTGNEQISEKFIIL